MGPLHFLTPVQTTMVPSLFATQHRVPTCLLQGHRGRGPGQAGPSCCLLPGQMVQCCAHSGSGSGSPRPQARAPGGGAGGRGSLHGSSWWSVPLACPGLRHPSEARFPHRPRLRGEAGQGQGPGRLGICGRSTNVHDGMCPGPGGLRLHWSARAVPSVFPNLTENSRVQIYVQSKAPEEVSSLTSQNVSIPEKGGSTPLNLNFMGTSVVQFVNGIFGNFSLWFFFFFFLKNKQTN